MESRHGPATDSLADASRADKMIVMLICHFDDTNPSGGLEKQAQLLAETLRARGENVVILGSTRRPSRAGWSQRGGVPVRLFWSYASPQVSGRYFPAALVWAFQLLIWIARHHRRIAVLHCHQIRIHAFAATLAKMLFGIPVILKSACGGAGADIRSIGSRKFFGAPGRRFLMQRADLFVATTHSIAQDLRDHGVPESRIALAPNGAPLSRKNSADRTPPELRRRRCLFLGRLEKDKNTLPLARAANNAFSGTDMRLQFWGAGPEAEALNALCDAPDGPAAYEGFLPDPRTILDDFGWLILPSDAEGLSNAMIEAMLHGVVPVTTRVSGCVDHIVPGETGFFLDGVDADSLERGLRDLAAIDAKTWSAMSQRVRLRAEKQFDIARTAAAYQSFYRALERDTAPDFALS